MVSAIHPGKPSAPPSYVSRALSPGLFGSFTDWGSHCDSGSNHVEDEIVASKAGCGGSAKQGYLGRALEHGSFASHSDFSSYTDSAL